MGNHRKFKIPCQFRTFHFPLHFLRLHPPPQLVHGGECASATSVAWWPFLYADGGSSSHLSGHQSMQVTGIASYVTQQVLPPSHLSARISLQLCGHKRCYAASCSLLCLHTLKGSLLYCSPGLAGLGLLWLLGHLFRSSQETGLRILLLNL